jgi:hypothetical protein
VDVRLFAQDHQCITTNITPAAGAILYGSAARHTTWFQTITVSVCKRLHASQQTTALATAWQGGKQDDSTCAAASSQLHVFKGQL